jgi:hypothetical protein
MRTREREQARRICISDHSKKKERNIDEGVRVLLLLKTKKTKKETAYFLFLYSLKFQPCSSHEREK